MMEKKNTVLLTVIAISTLLVAVVGATFAYFSANITGNNGKVTVTAQTAEKRDLFKSTGSPTISLSITADKMQNNSTVGSYTVTGDATTAINVELEAGSGKATCLYDVVYIPDATNYFKPSANAGNNKEFVLDGICSLATNSFSNADSKGNTKVMLKKDATISDSFDANVTTQTWSFTGKVFNLAVDQTDLIEKDPEFGGEIKIENVRCTNSTN